MCVSSLLGTNQMKKGTIVEVYKFSELIPALSVPGLS